MITCPQQSYLLNSHKTPENLDITTILTKETKFLIAKHLARLFNTCLTERFYPDILKIAKIISLHKNGTKYESENFRPILILSPVNNIIKTIIHKRLIDCWVMPRPTKLLDVIWIAAKTRFKILC